MRLESRKSRGSGGHSQAVRSISIDNESELDEKDLELCIQDHVKNASSASSRLEY